MTNRPMPHGKAAVKYLVQLGEANQTRGARIMADLTALAAKLDELGADVADLAADLTLKFAALQAAIDELTAGAITQEQIDALTAKATEVDAAIDALDASVEPAPEVPA